MDDRPDALPHAWTRRAKLAFAVFVAIAAFFLFTEHRAHVYSALPWLFLAACPLMHLFMHGGHGRHADHRAHGREERGVDDRSAGTAAGTVNGAPRVPNRSSQDHR